jgi:hypothetical protein
VSRPFRMSRYVLADENAMFDAINYQVVWKSNGRPNFILHVLCHPGMHMKSDMNGRLLAVGTVFVLAFNPSRICRVRIVVWPKKLAPCILSHEVGPGCYDRKIIVAGWSFGGRYRHLTGPAGIGLDDCL